MKRRKQQPRKVLIEVEDLRNLVRLSIDMSRKYPNQTVDQLMLSFDSTLLEHLALAR